MSLIRQGKEDKARKLGTEVKPRRKGDQNSLGGGAIPTTGSLTGLQGSHEVNQVRSALVARAKSKAK